MSGSYYDGLIPALAVGIVIAASSGAFALIRSEPADASAPGLYAEQVTAFDGVTLRRVSDTTNGTVCYVASARAVVYGGEGVAVSVSCLGGNP